MSTLGIVLPSLIIIIVISIFFYRVRDSGWIKTLFYGLRPVITELIAFAAIRFGLNSVEHAFVTWQTIGTLIIVFAALYGLMKYKLHPLTIIVASGILGVAFFRQRRDDPRLEICTCQRICGLAVPLVEIKSNDKDQTMIVRRTQLSKD